MKKAELVFIPLPFLSHLKPAIEIAKNLVKFDRNLSISMFLMKSPLPDTKLEAYIDSLEASPPKLERINFIILQNDYVVTYVNLNLIMNSFMEHQKPRVKNAVTKLIQSQNCRLAGFFIDQMCASMIDVAQEFEVPTYVFCTVSAAYVSLIFHLQTLGDQRNIDLSGLKTDPDAELVFPGFVNPVPGQILPDLLLDKVGISLYLDQFRSFREAKGIIVNTFTELEPHAFNSLSNGELPPVYPVGPILNLVRDDDDHGQARFNNGDSSESEIIKWLDDQPSSSVVFLCFGNLGGFSEDQVKEIAKALQKCGIQFLWSLRQRPSLEHDQTVEANTFIDTVHLMLQKSTNPTAKMGKIIGWAPQIAILSHPAIGGFVSHCGWNSILESLWFGVPIATWPLFGDQPLNAFELVKELGLAVEIKMNNSKYFMSDEDGMIVSSVEIEKGIRKVMENDSIIRKKVKEISEKCRKTMIDGGSSHSSLERLINNIRDNLA
ncbi:anthocyanidin 3-O-glucosyltransferase 6 [Ziziphus jujuba]|uniref:Glycosyltransferase n=1 Tax=Ziziphus jujuba TaxID=326968 RepID=A0A6P6GEU8_ZIZJJ|nr:anthocyanidin 3-O-glucosyltransferase 6 [Ziziphus jujuba]